MKKLLAAGSLFGAAFIGGLTPAYADSTPPPGAYMPSNPPVAGTWMVDSMVIMGSKAPVPGGLTVGSWTVSATGASKNAIPAGTTYRLIFDTGAWLLGDGAPTVTPPPGATVSKLGSGAFIVTLSRDLQPGQSLTGLWSVAEPIASARGTAEISLYGLPAGYADSNTSNDDYLYSNGGKGF